MMGGVVMDIAAMSMAMSQSKLQQNVGFALMKHVMDTAEQNGDMISQLLSETGNMQALEQAAQPHLGGNIDLKL